MFQLTLETDSAIDLLSLPLNPLNVPPETAVRKVRSWQLCTHRTSASNPLYAVSLIVVVYFFVYSIDFSLFVVLILNLFPTRWNL